MTTTPFADVGAGQNNVPTSDASTSTMTALDPVHEEEALEV